MNIFIDAVSLEGIIAFFDDSRQIIDRQTINVKGKESKQLPHIIDAFVNKNEGGYKSIKNIVFIHGPGSFTGIRAIVLTINTLKFIFPHISITPISYFSLFQNYPIIKPSSKKDVFVKFSEKDEVQILKNEEFIEVCEKKGITYVYGEEIPGNSLKFEKYVDYDRILKETAFSCVERASPLYIKKPNIS